MKFRLPSSYSLILKQNDTISYRINMRQLVFVLFAFLSCCGYAQLKFAPYGNEIVMTSPDGDATNYETCWCYTKFDGKSDSIIGYEPIVYPLPMKRLGKWGAIDKEGKTVLDFEFSKPVLLTENGRVKLENFEWIDHEWQVKDTGFVHLLDSAGNIESTYRVVDVHQGTFIASPDNYYWGLLNSNLETLLDFKYTSSHFQGEDFRFNEKGYVTFRENKVEGLHGVVNHKGEVIIPFKWKLLSYIITDENRIYAANEQKRRGYIDIHGRTVLPFIYEHLPRVVRDSNLVKTKDYTFFLDESLNQIGPKYQAFNKEGDVYFFKRNGKWGVMNENFEIIIPNTYTSIMDGPRLKDDPDFRSYIVVENGKYGLTTLKGENIIRPQFDCLCGLGYYAPSNYYVEFKKDDVSYKYNHKGELVEKGGKSGGACFCE